MAITIKTKYLRAASLFAANDDIRYYLCGVLIEAHPSGDAFLVATNGHVLAAANLKNAVSAPEADSWPCQIIIPDDAIARLLSIKTLGDTLTLDGAGKRWTLGDESSSTSFTPVDGKYPAWRAVIGRGKPVDSAAFDSTYLAVVAKAAKHLEADERYTCAKLHCREGAATLVRFCDKNFLAVLMPMTNDIEDGVPSWIAAQESTAEA